MALFSANLGQPALVGVGYRFYDKAEAPIGARITAGVTNAGGGWYTSEAERPANAASIRWDSTGTPSAVAREYFDPLALAIAAKTQQITAGSVSVLSPISRTGGQITARAADAWDVTFEDLGDLTATDALWFAIKRTPTTASDAEAVLFVELAAGVLYVNGSAAKDPAGASLVITDAAAGKIRLTVAALITAELPPENFAWSLKRRTAGSATTLAAGVFQVARAAIQAV